MSSTYYQYCRISRVTVYDIQCEDGAVIYAAALDVLCGIPGVSRALGYHSTYCNPTAPGSSRTSCQVAIESSKASSTCLAAAVGILHTTQIVFAIFTATAEPSQSRFARQPRKPVRSGSVTFLCHHGLHA